MTDDGLDGASDRDVRHELARDDGAGLGRADVHDRSGAGADDLLLHPDGLGDHREVRADGLVDAERDVGALGGLVAVELDGEGVLARREERDAGSFRWRR